MSKPTTAKYTNHPPNDLFSIFNEVGREVWRASREADGSIEIYNRKRDRLDPNGPTYAACIRVLRKYSLI